MAIHGHFSPPHIFLPLSFVLYIYLPLDPHTLKVSLKAIPNMFVHLQSVESKEKLRKELRKELAEKEDQLKKELAEKDAHISINSKQILDLQQQLQKVISFITMSKQTTRCVDFIPVGSRDEHSESSAVQATGRATGG